MAKRQRVDRNLAHYALQGIEAAIEKLQGQAAALRRSLTTSTRRATAGRAETMGGVVTAEETATGRFEGGAKKRTMSPEGRKRISEAQKARWAKQKGSVQAAPAAANGTSRTARRKKK